MQGLYRNGVVRIKGKWQKWTEQIYLTLILSLFIPAVL